MTKRSVLTLLSILTLALVARAAAFDPENQAQTQPARYLYVWAGSSHDSTLGLDVITVLDANPSSPGYGSVLAALTVDSSGRMPHHTEFTLPGKDPFFANDFTGNKSFLIDYSNPLTPRLAGRAEAVPVDAGCIRLCGSRTDT